MRHQVANGDGLVLPLERGRSPTRSEADPAVLHQFHHARRRHTTFVNEARSRWCRAHGLRRRRDRRNRWPLIRHDRRGPRDHGAGLLVGHRLLDKRRVCLAARVMPGVERRWALGARKGRQASHSRPQRLRAPGLSSSPLDYTFESEETQRHRVHRDAQRPLDWPCRPPVSPWRSGTDGCQLSWGWPVRLRRPLPREARHCEQRGSPPGTKSFPRGPSGVSVPLCPCVKVFVIPGNHVSQIKGAAIAAAMLGLGALLEPDTPKRDRRSTAGIRTSAHDHRHTRDALGSYGGARLESRRLARGAGSTSPTRTPC